jgi:hypothetical protein
LLDRLRTYQVLFERFPPSTYFISSLPLSEAYLVVPRVRAQPLPWWKT